MRKIWVTEHERLYRGPFGAKSGRSDGRVVLAPQHFDRLQRFDERLSLTESRQVFEWKSRYAKATQWVGVMQIPGLSVEVLPKIERPGDDYDGRERFARKNLLYMLSLTGELPLRERDVARQSVHSAPLIEALIRIFAERLFEELNRGVERGYVRREENLPVLKGKLLFSQHVRHNAARRERLYVGHDEFIADTRLNRIFKAACTRLSEVSSVPSTRERLGYCLMMLDGVSGVPVTTADFEGVTISRQNERFREIFNFCWFILSGQSPAATTGRSPSFSLFFDMNVVFESYVTALVRRYVLRGELADCRCYPQAKRGRRHLVFRPKGEVGEGYDPESHGAPTYPLKADILIRRGTDTLVLDTKWKRLSPRKGGRQGVSRNDLLQLYAYATRYEARQNVLLYPHVSGVDEQEFHLPLGPAGLQSIEVRFIDLKRDLQVDRDAVVAELREVIRRTFARPTGECAVRSSDGEI